jgi:hypothetical protein
MVRDVFAAKLIRFRTGQALRNVADLSRGY